ncbi:hypothetical protein DPMN_123847 [Dreissena polymorpha]|uniref:Uncharacterized protein n=1 Tax=Dreissena polymorpha TaxID=45954 RepID=A0A9D4GYA2_DREPO|nr:hypothetical protein DPMN_123847 [Dreissena polymorpha]
MNEFVSRATSLAIDLADESNEEKRRVATKEAAGYVCQQTAVLGFAVPVPPTSTSYMYRTHAPLSAAFGSAEQQNQFQQQPHLQQDFLFAANIAASVPPAHLTPQFNWLSHLQPPNVQPALTNVYRSPIPATESSTTRTASIIRKTMNIVSTPTSSPSLNQKMHGATEEQPQE